MRTKANVTVAVVAGFTLLAGTVACGGDDGGGSAAPTTVAGAAAGGGGGDACGFDQALIDAAKTEGRVNVVGAQLESEGEFIGKLLKEEYDISLTYSRQPTADAVQQIETSLEAGAETVDAAWLAEPSQFVTWTKENVVVELDPPNPDAFVEGLRDTTRYSLPVFSLPMGVLYNSSRLDEADVPSSWAELVQTRGSKIVAMANPSNSGSGLAYHYLLNKQLGDNYLSSFKGQRNHVTESGSTLGQLTLTGEADLSMPGYEFMAIQAKKDGEPLEVLYLDEVVPTTTTEVGVLAKAPHPNAAKLFAMFLVCDTFQNRITELGQRPVLKTAPLPEGAQDLSDRNIVTADVDGLLSQRPKVTRLFDEATK